MAISVSSLVYVSVVEETNNLTQKIKEEAVPKEQPLLLFNNPVLFNSN